MGKLQGKNVLITGASSGIGQAIAVRFAKEGVNIAIHRRRRALAAPAAAASIAVGSQNAVISRISNLRFRAVGLGNDVSGVLETKSS